MKVLLLGNSHSPYLPSLARALADAGAEVEIYDFLRGHSISVGGDEEETVSAARPVLGQWARVRSLRRFLKARGDLAWDVVNLHYVSPAYRFCLGPLRRSARAMVASVWGFDIMSAGAIARRLQSGIYRACGRITFNNPQRREVFGQRFGTLVPEDRQSLAFLPMGLFKLMDEEAERKSPQACRTELGIPENARVVVCGSNGNPQQQHEIFLQALRLSGEKFPSDACFVFPMTYGATEAYRDSIASGLNELKADSRVLTEFMDDVAVARLRLASDFFILLQKEDSFSAALQESFYAGAEVIAGSWLPYDFLREAGLAIAACESAEDLADLLLERLADLDREGAQQGAQDSEGRRRIEEMASERAAGRQWMACYTEALAARL